MTIEVLKPGMFSTVQDLGRSGYQQYGMLANGVTGAPRPVQGISTYIDYPKVR